MQMRRSPGVRAIDTQWHTERQRAREQAFSSDLDFFGDVERVKYDLDTAQIDGSDNPRVYLWRRAIDLFGINGTDIRELRNR